MLSPYKGDRYKAAADPDLVAFVEDDCLHTLDYDQTLEFYAEALPTLNDADFRYLGCVDRYFLFTHILGRHDGFHPWLFERCREVELSPDYHLDLWSREHYKAVDVNEPVPTPTGFKRHGDLKPGDWVFGSSGDPVKVIARTPVFTDADCWRVTFDDGYSVVVSGQHLWTVEKRSRRRVKGDRHKRVYRESVTLETRQIAEHDHTADDRYSIPVAPAVFQVEHILPIDPYTLGAWLGDGTRNAGTITCSYADLEIIENIRARGHVVEERSSTNDNSGLFIIDPGIRGKKGTGFRSLLTAMSLHKGKHIPRDYMVASVKQRLDLLRGLMDTDGHCNTRGTATFVNKCERLARDVHGLVASLGLKPRWNVFDYDHGQVYHVSFQSYEDMVPFCLRRKAARSKAGKAMRRRFIRSVERVDTIPVSCIQVDAHDGLYLIGKNHVTTHNSSLITFAGIVQEIINDPEITIGVFSFNKQISAKFVAQIKREFESNFDLTSLYPDICWIKPSTEASIWSSSAFTVRRKGNPKEATVEGHGLVDGQPTSRHFKLRVYDDVVTRESVTTPDQVKKTTEAWELSDNLGSGEGRFWMIGTRYAFGDTYGEILDRQIVTPRVYAATDNGKPDGEPVFLDTEEWEKKKRTQKSTLAAQMLQNPLSGKEQRFVPEWFRPWFTRPTALNVYILGDPSKGARATSDRTAIAVIGVDWAGNKYLLDGFCHRMTLSQRWDALKHLHKKWTDQVGVALVKVGWERFGQQTDDEYFAERMRAESYVFAIHELAWPREGSASKIDRVERLQPDFEYGDFYLPGLVHVSGEGECLWDVDTEQGQITTRKPKGERKDIAAVKARGQGYLAVSAIVRRNEDGEIYDLTRVLMDEMLFFPFAAHDDLVDAVSRIYDIEPLPASTREELPAMEVAADE